MVDYNESDNEYGEYHAQYNGKKLRHSEGLDHIDSVQANLDSNNFSA